MIKNLNTFDNRAAYEAASLTYPNVSYLTAEDEVVWVKEDSNFSVRFYKRDGSHVDVMTPVVGDGENNPAYFTNLGLTVNSKMYYTDTDTDGQPTDIVEIRLGRLCEAIDWNSSLSKFYDETYANFPVSISALTYTSDCQVQRIGSACLTRMSGLQKLLIPASVTGMSSYADWMVNVEYVEFLGETPPDMSVNWEYTNFNRDCPVYVPQGTRDAYLAALRMDNIETRLQERS